MTKDLDAGAPSLGRRLAAGLIPTFFLVLLSFVLPAIRLDTDFADLVVRVADTSTWAQLPFLCLAAVLVIVSRPGLGARRRVVEAGAMIAAMSVALALMASFNEYLLKPTIASPRPNIVALAEQDALGPGITTGAQFYALGDKDTRREQLAPHLAELEQPALSELVREHWAHETGFSFPSGHATSSMTFATMIFALGLVWLSGWRRRLSSLAPIWAVCVVYSRPLLRVHRPIDVSVGTLVGMVLGLLAFGAISWVADRIADAPPRPAPEPSPPPSR